MAMDMTTMNMTTMNKRPTKMVNATWRVAFRTTLTRVVLVAAIGVLVAPTTTAQPANNSRIPDLIQKLPIKGSSERQQFLVALSECGGDDVAVLCRRIAAAPSTETAKERALLSGWILAVNELPAAHRQHLSQGLRSVLHSRPRFEVRRFFVEQLHYVDPEAALVVLEDTLAQLANAKGNEALECIVLVEDVVRAVRADRVGLSKNGRDALREICERLPAGTDPRVRLAVLGGLAESRDVESATLFHAALQLAGDATSEALRNVCLDGLAAIGDERSASLFARDLQADSPTRRAAAARRLAALAQAYAARGQSDEAHSIYASLMSEPAGQPVAVRLMALRGVVELRGVQATPQIVAALTSVDPSLRRAGLELGAKLDGEGVDRVFGEQLKEASPEVAVALLELLGARRNRESRPAIIKATQNSESIVQSAAWKALAQVDPYGSVAPILEGLKSASDAAASPRQATERRKFLAGLLAELPGESVDSQIASQLHQASPELAISLIDVLSRRNQPGKLSMVEAQAHVDDAKVRRAAIRAVGRMTTDLAPAIRLLQSTEDERDRVAIQRMGLAIIDKMEGRPSAAGDVLKFMKSLSNDDVKRRSTTIAWLGALGGKRAFKAVFEAWTDPREELHDAAVGALKTWPDPEQARGVLAFASKADNVKDHVLALRSYLRLVIADPQLTIEQRLAAFEDAFRVARRETEQKLVIAKLADLPHPKTLEFLHQFEGSRKVGLEAELASLRVAESMLPGRWSFVRQKCQYLRGATEHEAVRELATRIEARAKAFEFVADWRVAGPYSQDGNRGQRNLMDSFAPEIQGKASDVEWRVVPVNPKNYWLVDLTSILSGDHCVAYLYTRVRSRAGGKAVLELGSDDGIRVWWNGKSVHHNPVPRGCTPGQDRVEVEFQQGWNDVVLKVSQLGGGWGACLRILQSDGKPVPDLIVDPGEGRPKFETESR